MKPNNKSRWETAVDALPLGVIIFAESGKEVWRNSVASNIGGARHTEVLIDNAVNQISRLVLGGELMSSQMNLSGPPIREISLQGIPLVDGGALVTVKDITDLLQLEKTRTDFVANLSHELKTPVGAIAILAELLESETDSDTVKKLAQRIEFESHRMTQMMDDLFELSGIEKTLALSSVVNLTELVLEVENNLSLSASRAGILIKIIHEDTPVLLMGDRAQLQSAISNLVENAIKFSNARDVVEVKIWLDESNVFLTVSDQGIGIPAESLPRLFERFYRVDKARSRGTGGSGLGLAIASHAISNHRGTLTVASSEGEGSVFSICLPR